jgi:hypothetical protein
MQDQNFDPYAPPAVTNPYAGASAGIIRQGNLLIVPQNSAPYLPCDTCIKCGQPSKKILTRNLAWSHPALLLLILAWVLIYIIVALIVQKKIRLRVGLCAQHAAVRSRRALTGWLLFLGAIAVWVYFANRAGHAPSFVYFLIPLMIVASLVWAVLTSQYPISPKHISDFQAEIRGAGEAYLKQFPGR